MINSDNCIYMDGDIVILDNVRQLTEFRPIQTGANIIILCSEGRIELDINGSRRQLEKNDVLFSCPDVVLSGFMLSPDFTCQILCLSERIIHELLREHIGTWNRAVYVCRTNVMSLTDETVHLHNLYHTLIRQSLLMPDRQFGRPALLALIQSMLFELSSILYEPDTAEPQAYQTQSRQLFDQFLTMLSKERVKHRPVGHYAYMLNITQKYLTMVCIHESGKPAKDWINQYVVEDVRYHLRNTATPIKEIADRLGFANISHFGSYVRRHFGMSPTVFRAQAQE